MSALCIASKANQATTVPVLLVASYVNESDPNASIDIKFQEAETLKSKDGASVELLVKDDTPLYGFDKAISGLTAAYPSLQGKHEALVGDFALNSSGRES